MSPDLEPIEVLRPSGEHRSYDREVLRDVSGSPVADLGLAPGLMVRRTLDELRSAPAQPVEERLDAIVSAGTAFAGAEVRGESAEAYCRAVVRIAGLPSRTARFGLRLVAAAAENIARTTNAQRSRGAAADWREDATIGGSAVWVPRGRVLAVQARGTHPGPHTEWLIALALGYRVAVRPSRRDPYTPRRLMRALLDGGLQPGHVALLPTSREGADTLVRGADLAVVYGGDQVVRRYANDPRVLTQGPGRSKILIDGDTDWRERLDLLVESVAGNGGTACINATAVFVEGDARALAQELAERLNALPVLPPEHPSAALPAYPIDQATAIAEWTRAQAKDAEPLFAGPLVADLGDGSAALRPAVFLLDDPGRPQAGLEMPFPCVWVAPWSREAGAGPLRHSLVLTLLTGDKELVDACVAEPSIRNVHLGGHPTNWIGPGLPHDGYLGDFLMRAKTVAR